MSLINQFYTLSDGFKLPKLGFGTFNEQFVQYQEKYNEAIECGYRFFDTASLYESERPLGAALKDCGLPREEFIIESKLWYDEMGYDGAKRALERSLKRLGTDYLDLYLIHWPRQTGAFDEDWKELDRQTWRALEEMVEEGTVKHLGTSNFLPHHLEALLPHCNIKPIVNQLELHPGYSQEAAVAYCHEKKIQPIAYCPLARQHPLCIAEDGILAYLAKQYGKSIQQIMLRFLIQKGILPIPGADRKEYMLANMDIFDFDLTAEELSILSCMPQNTWLGEHPDFSIPDRKTNQDDI